ncbi:ankyrin [Lactarius hengduanensis]|nr:ankyrin [Lactarius hengduanensis]
MITPIGYVIEGYSFRKRRCLKPHWTAVKMTTDPYSPSPAFEEAVAYLSNASSLTRVSNSVKLELYGLFKMLTVATSPNTSRPSFFDIAGRAKWDAWALAAQTFEGRPSEAEHRYVEIARSLGWTEGSSAAVDDETEDGGGGGGSGMGISVSVMSPPTLDDDSSGLHGHAMRDDVAAVSAFLSSNEGADINVRDEYGYTALHLAADRGNVAVVEFLLKQGADKTLMDTDGYTATDLATIAQQHDVVALLERTGGDTCVESVPCARLR